MPSYTPTEWGDLGPIRDHLTRASIAPEKMRNALIAIVTILRDCDSAITTSAYCDVPDDGDRSPEGDDYNDLFGAVKTILESLSPLSFAQVASALLARGVACIQVAQATAAFRVNFFGAAESCASYCTGLQDALETGNAMADWRDQNWQTMPHLRREPRSTLMDSRVPVPQPKSSAALHAALDALYQQARDDGHLTGERDMDARTPEDKIAALKRAGFELPQTKAE